MIEPTSPVTAAAHAAQEAALARGASPIEATAAGLNAALAEFQRLQGPLAALALGAIKLPGRSE